jgi:uncharacterized protein YbjT (DUF2867 family)
MASNPAKSFTAALIGGSGNVGSEILRSLLGDQRVGQVVLIGRREIESVKNNPRVMYASCSMEPVH